MAVADPPVGEELERVWNAMRRGNSTPSTLDPALVDTLQTLVALDHVPPPDPVFVNRVQEELMASVTPLIVLDPQPGHPPNGHTLGTSQWGVLPTPSPAMDRGRWGVAHFATVVLVVIVLVSSYLLFSGPLRPRQERATLPGIAAVNETPSSPGLPGIAADTVLMQSVIEALPDGAGWAGIQRTTLAPGAVWPVGTRETDGEGPLLVLVEAGHLTVTPDGPITITRAGEPQPHSVPAGQDVTLDVGDQAFTPSGVPSRRRNEGAVPAVIIEAAITTYAPNPPPDGVSVAVLVEDASFRSPPLPFLMTVRRVTVETGASLAPVDIIGLRELYVDQGSFEVHVGGEGTPTGSFLLPQGASRSFGGSGRYTTVPADWVLSNPGPDAATLLVMTITAGNPLEQTPIG